MIPIQTNLLQPVTNVNKNPEIDNFNEKMGQALRAYIQSSTNGQIQRERYQLAEPGTAIEAFDRLQTLKAMGESLGSSATDLPLYKLLNDLLSPAYIELDLSQHKILAPLFGFTVDPRSRWQCEGSLISNYGYFVANHTVNTIVAWSVQGKITAEIYALLPSLDVYVRFTDAQAGDWMEMQASLASLVLIMTPGLEEIRKIFHNAETILPALLPCVIRDSTLPPKMVFKRASLDFLCRTRPTLIDHMGPFFFDEYLHQVLAMEDSELKGSAAREHGKLPDFINNLQARVWKRGYCFPTESMLLQSLQKGMAILPEVRAIGLSPTHYRKLIASKKWYTQLKKVEESEKVAPALQPAHEIQLARPRAPIEERLVSRLRDYCRCALGLFPCNETIFYNQDEERCVGMKRYFKALAAHLNRSDEPCHPAVRQFLESLLAASESQDQKFFISGKKLKILFPHADENAQFEIETSQELLSHGCYVKNPLLALFSMVCLGTGDSAPLVAIFNLDPMMQMFRLKVSSGTQTFELRHLNCFSFYMMTRTEASPSHESLFADSESLEQRLRLLMIPAYLVYATPEKNKWLSLPGIILNRAKNAQNPFKIKLPDPFLKRLEMLVEAKANSQQLETFKNRKPLKEGTLVPPHEGDRLSFLYSPVIQGSIEIFLTTLQTEPAAPEGLINIGDSCWMNATLQVLKTCERQLLEAMEQNPKEKELLKQTLFDVVTSMQVVNPEEMRQKLIQLRTLFYESRLHPEFSLKGAHGEERDEILNQKHDPAILIEALLDMLAIEIETWQKLTGIDLEGEKQVEGLSKIKQESLKIISLPVGAASLQEALKEYFDHHIVNEGMLDKAGEKRYPVYKKSTRLKNIPSLFVVQLNRFERDTLERYLETPLKTDAVLDLTPFLLEADGRKALYRLKACIHYHPRSRHYTANVNENGGWSRFDDSKPRHPLTEGEVDAGGAYILLFEHDTDAV